MDHEEEVQQFQKQLPDIIKDAGGYDEIYGVQLLPTGEFYDPKIARRIVYKLVKAFQFDVPEARKHAVEILRWRGEFDPLSAAFLEKHDKKYDQIGALTLNDNGQPNEKVVTWNKYGTIDDTAKMFSHVDEFIRWRVGLMEQATLLLDFEDATNDYMVQVHDYKGASLLGMSEDSKKASTSIIKLFRDYYPEVLYKKYFVNVPMLMSFLFNVFKSFIPEVTRKKMTMLRNGDTLSQYLDGPGIPIEYGGSSGSALTALRFIFDKDQLKLPPYVSYLLEEKVVDDID